MRRKQLSIMILSFFLMSTLWGSLIGTSRAVWTNPQQLTMNGAVGIESDIAITFDENGVIHFAHLLAFVGLEQNNDIYYGNNSDPSYDWGGIPLTISDKVAITNRPNGDAQLINIGRPSLSLMENSTPAIGFNAQINQTTRVEAFVSIFNFTTSEPMLVAITNNTGGFTNNHHVSVAAYSNNTLFAVWACDNGIYYTNIHPNGTIVSREHLLTTTGGDTEPLVSIINETGHQYLSVAYVSGNQVYFTQSIDDGAFSAATALSGANCNNIEMDASGDSIGVTWVQDGNDIQARLSEDFGSSWTSISDVTSDGATTEETNPDLYVRNGSFAEVVYQKEMTENYTVAMRSNYDGGFNSQEDILAEYIQDSNVQSHPNIAGKDGRVVVFFLNYIKPSATWYPAEIYGFGYQTFLYNENDDNDLELSIDDDPAGQYLFEGIKITYNSSDVSTDLNLTITISDRVNGNTTVWSNSTLYYGNGTNDVSHLFWSPDYYFITNYHYDLIISNGSDISNHLIKIPFESFDYQSNTIYNISSSSSNGTYLEYNLAISPIFEYGNYLTPDQNGLENEDTRVIRSFGSDNYVDLHYFYLESGRDYNFYLHDDIVGDSNHVSLNFINDSIQLFNVNASIFEMNSSDEGVNWGYKVTCNRTGNYGVIIQPDISSYNLDIEYDFYYSAIPYAPGILTPYSGQFIGNTAGTQSQPITLSWYTHYTDTDIAKYELQIYNSSTLVAENLLISTNISGINNKQYIYDAVEDGNLYWRVRSIDDSSPENIGEWSTVFNFKYDNNAPLAPVVNDLAISYNVGYVLLTWNPADDGIFDAAYYNIYMATRPVFKSGVAASEYQEYLITSFGVRQNYYTFENAQNYHYYFAIEAVDSVGLHSNLSNIVDTSIAIGGYVSATGQELYAQVGDTLIYEITNVISDDTDSALNPLMNFYYHQFIKGLQFHFWVQKVNPNDVYPVLAAFYSRDPDAFNPEWELIDDETPIQMLLTSPDITYQQDVLELFTMNELPGYTFESRSYETLWRSETDVINVWVHTFYTPADDDGNQATASYFVDKTTGIVCEFTVYDSYRNYGYSLQLLTGGTSAVMSESDWQNAYLWYILVSIGFAVVIALIIKKVEY